jgi:hypothetical protein
MLGPAARLLGLSQVKIDIAAYARRQGKLGTQVKEPSSSDKRDL